MKTHTNIFKGFICFIVIIAITMSMSMTVFAAGSLSIQQVSDAKLDNEFTVEIFLDDNPGIMKADFNIAYNPEQLEFANISYGPTLSGWSGHISPGKIVISANMVSYELTTNGRLAAVTFKVLDDSSDPFITVSAAQCSNVRGTDVTIDGATVTVHPISASEDEIDLSDSEGDAAAPDTDEELTAVTKDGQGELTGESTSRQTVKSSSVTTASNKSTVASTRASTAASTVPSTKASAAHESETATAPSTNALVTTTEQTASVVLSTELSSDEPMETEALNNTEPAVNTSAESEIEDSTSADSNGTVLAVTSDGKAGGLKDAYAETADEASASAQNGAKSKTLAIAIIIILLTICVIVVAEGLKRRD